MKLTDYVSTFEVIFIKKKYLKYLTYICGFLFCSKRLEAKKQTIQCYDEFNFVYYYSRNLQHMSSQGKATEVISIQSCINSN